jgi:serine/threonine protein kinase
MQMLCLGHNNQTEHKNRAIDAVGPHLLHPTPLSLGVIAAPACSREVCDPKRKKPTSPGGTNFRMHAFTFGPYANHGKKLGKKTMSRKRKDRSDIVDLLCLEDWYLTDHHHAAKLRRTELGAGGNGHVWVDSRHPGLVTKTAAASFEPGPVASLLVELAVARELDQPLERFGWHISKHEHELRMQWPRASPLHKMRLDLLEVKLVVSHVLEQLAVAHARGIVHGDVSPDQILWNQQHMRAYLNDWGAAYLVQYPIATNGKHCFRAPELFEVEKGAVVHRFASPAADVFALGVCVLYWIWDRRLHFFNLDSQRIETLDRDIRAFQRRGDELRAFLQGRPQRAPLLHQYLPRPIATPELLAFLKDCLHPAPDYRASAAALRGHPWLLKDNPHLPAAPTLPEPASTFAFTSACGCCCQSSPLQVMALQLKVPFHVYEHACRLLHACREKRSNHPLAWYVAMLRTADQLLRSPGRDFEHFLRPVADQVSVREVLAAQRQLIRHLDGGLFLGAKP